jgi:hypothetical protein
MTWLDHHHRSTKLAAAARKSVRLGDERSAERLYEKAATEAERALALVPREKRVTFGVIAMLAHRLWRSARRADDAARVAELIRGSPELFPITVNPLDGGGRAPIFSARDRARRSGEPTTSSLVSEEEETLFVT